MDILKKINALRRILMHGLTRNIGNSDVNPHVDRAVEVIVSKILVCRPNHRLGNLLLITPLLQEVINTFPQCKIDLFVKGNIAPTLFKNYENINQIIQLPRKPFKHLFKYIQAWMLLKKNRYDIVIDGVKSSASGKLSVQLANGKYKVFGNAEANTQSKYVDHEHMAKYPVYNFRSYLARKGFIISNKQIPPLNLKLTPHEIAEGQQLLTQIVNNEKKTICLFTYATGDKCYTESWWAQFYERLSAEQPNHNIIEVLPIENISKLLFKVPTFYSTDIRKIGSLIANTEVFIGADSGMMHLASSVQAPTVGLFSVTDPDVYKPYNNNNSHAIKTTVNNIGKCLTVINSILRDKSNGNLR